ncbi:MAG: PAAR domain-containing protein [Gemmatimonadales bacterium]
MPQPAARVGDMHVCPMVTPGVPRPRRPVLPPGGITVLIGGMPAARVGDMCLCVGPPDVVAMGAFTGTDQQHARGPDGSLTAHGGTIVMGCPTVMVG